METINGLMTALLIILFLGIWVWVWSSRNKKTFEKMSTLPLEDEMSETQEADHE